MDAQKQTILIVGATSAIGESWARLMARRGNDLLLVARQSAKLAAVSANLRLIGAGTVTEYCADFGDVRKTEAIFAKIRALPEKIDIALITHGTLPDNAACETDWSAAQSNYGDNLLSAIHWLQMLAQYMTVNRHGTIIAISSVAGDRGRQSNYYYGSAKAALSVFTQGLRNRLTPMGVRVLTVKPGFVDTPMSAHIQNKNFLWAKPSHIAAGIDRALRQGKTVVYLPGFWRWIMFAIRGIPETIFRRMKL